MILIDTSVWISVFQDKTGEVVAILRKRVDTDVYVLSRFNQLEILQGAKNKNEWRQLNEYLATQVYLEASMQTWREAAMIYFDLRRKGFTVNSPIDCCIAQIALDYGALLLHSDHDFETITKVRNLKQEYFQHMK